MGPVWKSTVSGVSSLGTPLAAAQAMSKIPVVSLEKMSPSTVPTSAGVTLMTAITSLLTDVKVDHELAMTGEITLRGTVLPVGGVKEKVLAASRAGCKRVLLPEKCRKDLLEISEDIKTDLEFIFVNEMTEVLSYALGDDVLERGKKLAKKKKKPARAKKSTKKAPNGAPAQA